MGKIVDKVTSHGKNFNTGDFSVMVCPECATLYENKVAQPFIEDKTFFIKEGRQVKIVCKTCNCSFERKIYDKITPQWRQLIPVLSLIAWIICIILFIVALFIENIILGISSIFFGISFFIVLIFTGIDIDF